MTNQLCKKPMLSQIAPALLGKLPRELLPSHGEAFVDELHFAQVLQMKLGDLGTDTKGLDNVVFKAVLCR